MARSRGSRVVRSGRTASSVADSAVQPELPVADDVADVAVEEDIAEDDAAAVVVVAVVVTKSADVASDVAVWFVDIVGTRSTRVEAGGRVRVAPTPARITPLAVASGMACPDVPNAATSLLPASNRAAVRSRAASWWPVML